MNAYSTEMQARRVE